MDTRTNEIINRFKSSWAETESFYDDLVRLFPEFEGLKSIRKFIFELQKNGASGHFRLGTSLDALIISRSVDHGLRPDQKYLKVEALSNGKFEISLRDGDRLYCELRIDNFKNDGLSKLLKVLQNTSVD